MKHLPNLLRAALRVASILTLSLSGQAANATNYYVSPNGSDANNGTSPATAWRTIEKLNQMLPHFVHAGDQVLFERGGQFRGQVMCGSEAFGSAGSPVIFGAYGNGADPIIDGSAVVSGWTQHQGSIWKAYVGQKVGQVYVGGVRMTIARMPNSGWYRNDQGSVFNMYSADLTQPDGFWTGTRCVLRNTASSVDTLPVVGYTNGTLTFGLPPMNQYMLTDDWGFYMENRLDLLDTQNEWYYDPVSGYLYLQAPNNADPNGLLIEASVSWAGLWMLVGREYITMQDISFRHQRYAGVLIEDGSHMEITGCSFQDLYHGILANGHNNRYTNNTFSHTLATGCFMLGSNSLFEGNVLEHIAEVMGAGETGWGYFGVRCQGQNHVLRGNRFESIGYIPICVYDNPLVEKNIIHNYLTLLNDGAAIAFDDTDGMIVQDNIIQDVVCGLDGSATVPLAQARYGHGIYFGMRSNVNAIIRRNTIANVSGVGIVADHTMNAHGWEIRDNTIFNCDIGISISDWCNASGPYAVAPYYVANYDDQYSGNIIYGLNKDQLALRFYNCHSALPTDFGTFTNNRYFNPYNEIGIFHFGFLSGQYYYGLEHWQAVRGEEAGSTRSPLHLSEWTTVSELSGDLLPNGTFPSAVTGWDYWPTNVEVTHDMNNLDNGCARIHLPDNSQTSYAAMRNQEWFPLQNGQDDWYRLDITMQSDAPGYVLARVRGESQINDPYALWERMLPFGTERRDNSFYFRSPNAENAQVVFVNQWTEPMYQLDNVHLHKVQVQANDPLERQMILVNDQFSEQTFTLTGCWSDVEGVTYSGSISLAAFSSKVLVREEDGSCLSTSTGEGSAFHGSPAVVVYPNPVESGGTISFTGGVEGMVTLYSASGQQVHQERLPKGSTGMMLPKNLPPGLYTLRLTNGSGLTERLVVR